MKSVAILIPDNSLDLRAHLRDLGRLTAEHPGNVGQDMFRKTPGFYVLVPYSSKRYTLKNIADNNNDCRNSIDNDSQVKSRAIPPFLRTRYDSEEEDAD